MTIAPSFAAQTRRGILFLAFAIFCFTAMDALAKHLVSLYPTVTVVWARFVGHFLCVAVFLGPRFLPALRTSLPWVHVFRSLTQLGATVFFFLSLSYIGLGEATALAGIAPLLITLGASLFLGERLTRARVIGVVLAMIGALILIRPGSDVFSPAAFLPMICALSYAANMLLTRFVGIRESPWAAMIYASVAGMGLTSLVLPFYWVPLAPWDLPAFLALGALGALAQLFMIRAYSLAEAGTLAPFGYLDIVFAMLWSMAVFADMPDGATLIGALVIVLAGLYVWHQETRGRRAQAKS